jgi:hypothetical protein
VICIHRRFYRIVTYIKKNYIITSFTLFQINIKSSREREKEEREIYIYIYTYIEVICIHRRFYRFVTYIYIYIKEFTLLRRLRYCRSI